MSLDLDAIRARCEAAHDEVVRMCAEKPESRWRWSIPANPQRDSDLILSAALMDVPDLLAEVERLRADVDEERLRSALLRQQVGELEAEIERLEAAAAAGRSVADLTVCHNLGCMVMFHADETCPACHDMPRSSSAEADHA